MDAIDKARKSLVSTEDTVEKSAEVEKTDPDVKAQEEATKSTEEAEKNVNQATISDDNEKVTKDVDDDDDVEESADKKDKATKSVDEAEKSEDEPAVEKNTDAKTEEAKAKQHKELTNVDDPKGHEEASKSFDTKAVIDALTKSVDTMAEMQKSYKELAEASMEIAKSFLAKQAPIEDQAEKSVEPSQDKKCKTAKSDDDDDQEPDGDADDEAKDDKEDKAKKSVEEPADNADEAEKSVEEPAEEDKAEKSIPTGKAVATGAEEAKDDTVDKSVETQEDGVTKEALENVIAKSLLGFDGVQSGVNLERKHALKSLLADTRELKGTTVPDSFIERYNEI